jgi:hypothetical protein
MLLLGIALTVLTLVGCGAYLVQLILRDILGIGRED